MKLGTQCFNQTRRSTTTTKKIEIKKPEIPEYKNTIPDQKNSTEFQNQTQPQKRKNQDNWNHPVRETKDWRKPTGIMGHNRRNNACIIGIPGGEEKEKGTESIFNATTEENL